MALGFPSVGQAVKTHLPNPLDQETLAASVRSFGGSGSLLRPVWCGAFAPGPRDSLTDDGIASAFSARRREPSFYQGLNGPLLRSALQGGIAYPRGLGLAGPH